MHVVVVDIGGTHVTTAVVSLENGILESICRRDVNTSGTCHAILADWGQCILDSHQAHAETHRSECSALAFAMPGPFAYGDGVSSMRGVEKYDALFALNIRQWCLNKFAWLGGPSVTGLWDRDSTVRFQNDASCFLLGEIWQGSAKHQSRVIGITLGTGFGSAFFKVGSGILHGPSDADGVTAHPDVPEGGFLYTEPYLDGTADTYFSSRWFARRCQEYAQSLPQDSALGGESPGCPCELCACKSDAAALSEGQRVLEALSSTGGAVLAHLARHHCRSTDDDAPCGDDCLTKMTPCTRAQVTVVQAAQRIFHDFGTHLGTFLAPWIDSFEPTCIVFGGSISQSLSLFLPAMTAALNIHSARARSVKLCQSKLGEHAALYGAALQFSPQLCSTLGQSATLPVPTHGDSLTQICSIIPLPRAGDGFGPRWHATEDTCGTSMDQDQHMIGANDDEQALLPRTRLTNQPLLPAEVLRALSNPDETGGGQAPSSTSHEQFDDHSVALMRERVRTIDIPAEPAPQPVHGEYDVYPIHPLSSTQSSRPHSGRSVPASSHPPQPLVQRGYFSFARMVMTRVQEATSPLVVLIDGDVGVHWSLLRTQLAHCFESMGAATLWHDIRVAWKDEATLDTLLAPWLGGDDPIFGKRYCQDLESFFDLSALDMMQQQLGRNVRQSHVPVTLVYGPGSFLLSTKRTESDDVFQTLNPMLAYLDVPKNEIQYRQRQGAAPNIGRTTPLPAKKAYKRCYFVDWPVAIRHKAKFFPLLDAIIDEQRGAIPLVRTSAAQHDPGIVESDLDVCWMEGTDFRAAVTRLIHSPFRVRPWFEPGPWGGQWMKKNIQFWGEHARNEVNLAWSFELIAPENGVVFASVVGESKSLLEEEGQSLKRLRLFEVWFDWVMHASPPISSTALPETMPQPTLLGGLDDNEWGARAVLGEMPFAIFGTEFPIRTDFLDTVKGGNLSIQCHPKPSFIEQFGETFTQDESYYILHATPQQPEPVHEGDSVPGGDATSDMSGPIVYCGFQDSIDAAKFKDILRNSVATGQSVAVADHVQCHPSKTHDYFLIPHGTVHGAGEGNLTLEISATPYIFTFKMYDWLRPGMDGLPRPMNIERAWKNLDFDRQGAVVSDTLLSKPVLVSSHCADGTNLSEDGSVGERPSVEVWHLPTHPQHFWEVHRLVVRRGSAFIPRASSVQSPETVDAVECVGWQEGLKEPCVHVVCVVDSPGAFVDIVPQEGGSARALPGLFRMNYGETSIVPAAAGAYFIHALDQTVTVLIISVKPVGRLPAFLSGRLHGDGAME